LVVVANIQVRPLKPEAWRRVPREQQLAWGQAVLRHRRRPFRSRGPGERSLVPLSQKGNGLIFPSSSVGGSGGAQAPAARSAPSRGRAARRGVAGRPERRQRERTWQRLRETRRETSSLVDSLKPRNRIGRRGGRDGWQSTASLLPCPVLSRGPMKSQGSVIVHKTVSLYADPYP